MLTCRHQVNTRLITCWQWPLACRCVLVIATYGASLAASVSLLLYGLQCPRHRWPCHSPQPWAGRLTLALCHMGISVLPVFTGSWHACNGVEHTPIYACMLSSLCQLRHTPCTHPATSCQPTPCPYAPLCQAWSSKAVSNKPTSGMSWAAHHAGYVLASGNAATQSIGMFSSSAAKGLLRVTKHLHWVCATAVLHVTSNAHDACTP